MLSMRGVIAAVLWLCLVAFVIVLFLQLRDARSDMTSLQGAVTALQEDGQIMRTSMDAFGGSLSALNESLSEVTKKQQEMGIVLAQLSQLSYRASSSPSAYREEDGRNAQRRSDVNTLLNAIYQYAIDNQGNIPDGISAVSTEICASGVDCAGLVDLRTLIGTYLLSVPRDPLVSRDSRGSGYFVSITQTQRVTVRAPNAENSKVEVTR